MKFSWQVRAFRSSHYLLNSNNVSQLKDHCTNVCLSVVNYSYYRHPPACTRYLKHIKYMCLNVLINISDSHSDTMSR
jgi:hypothetical protein